MRPTRTILIIDDVVSEAMTLDRLCRAFGAETICAASTAEAAALLRSTPVAAIITDLVMPGADGLDCLFMIAEQSPSLPVMAITASEPLLLKAAGELGDQYGLRYLTCVSKPVDIAVLRDFVAAAGVEVRPANTALH